MEEIGVKMDFSNLEHPQSNWMVGKMMGNLVKIMHAAVTEGKDPSELLKSFLREYRASPNISTRVAPSVLLFGGPLKTRLSSPPNLL